jgi:hypothetical protein
MKVKFCDVCQERLTPNATCGRCSAQRFLKEVDWRGWMMFEQPNASLIVEIPLMNYGAKDLPALKKTVEALLDAGFKYVGRDT